MRERRSSTGCPRLLPRGARTASGRARPRGSLRRVFTCVSGEISPVLANMTLDGLERVAHAAAPGRLGRSQVNVVRYADDFLVTARTPELLNEKIIPAIKTFLVERGLELSEEKSKVTDVETG